MATPNPKEESHPQCSTVEQLAWRDSDDENDKWDFTTAETDRIVRLICSPDIPFNSQKPMGLKLYLEPLCKAYGHKSVAMVLSLWKDMKHKAGGKNNPWT